MGMRRPLIASMLLAAAVALTGCSTGAPTMSAESTNQTAEVLNVANVDKVIASYSGDVTKLPTTFGEPTKRAAKIGWSSPRTANELVGRLGLSIEKAVGAMGGTVVGYDADADVSRQVGQMQQLINDKVDAIIVWPLDATALGPVVKQAKAAGIPVVAMEATPNADGNIGDIAGQVIYGRDLQAYVAASLMAELHPGGEVAVSKFAVPVPSITYYAERASYWAAQKGLKVVGTYDNMSDDVAGGQAMASPIIAKYPNLVGLLSYNDATAMGTMAAAKAAAKNLVAFGQNGEDAGVEAVRSGKLALTYQPPVVDWGRELVRGAYLASEGKDIPKAVFTGPGTFISSANIDTAQKMQSLILAAYGG
jgi:ribose transport system substrate-binding protein